ncbi:MAG: hypothetical protein AAF961_09425 [Planctomycetota bacterium]
MAAKSPGKTIVLQGLHPLSINRRALERFDAQVTSQLQEFETRFFQPRKHRALRLVVMLTARPDLERYS